MVKIKGVKIMRHKGTALLTTKRLVLRKFKIEDAENMYHNWASDPEVTRYLTWPAHSSVEVTKMILNEWITQDHDQQYMWAIALKDNDEVIGNISVVKIEEDIKCVHIGYCLSRKWWHQGITTEAFAAVIQFLFEEVQVNRIEAHHDVLNPNSGKVMAKCGLQYEGTLRQTGINQTGLADMAVYALLAQDYPKAV
ncbi:GNAT family N-acetyltransferase [Dielma fastidiosa]|uniref:GNAT family N-acetyltransferase n=1 Tax=Dielma fastidiosa TaxID=1034346 RepID=UPI003569A508